MRERQFGMTKINTTKRKWHRRGFWSLIGMVAVLGLAACSSGGSLPAQGATPVQPVQGDNVVTQVPAEGESTVSPTPADPTEAAPPAVSESLEDLATEESVVEEAAPPPVREELHATDPSTVQLASGEVQLVEFFAFW